MIQKDIYGNKGEKFTSVSGEIVNDTSNTWKPFLISEEQHGKPIVTWDSGIEKNWEREEAGRGCHMH